MLAAGCGLRQGEAFGLAKGDFDFEAGKVRIRRQLIRIGKAIVFKLPKGGKERTVPLSPGLARLAKAQIEAYEPQAYTLPWMYENGEFADDEHRCKILFRWHGDHPRTHGKCLQTSSYNEDVRGRAERDRSKSFPPPCGARWFFWRNRDRTGGLSMTADRLWPWRIP
jgi:integrase